MSADPAATASGSPATPWTNRWLPVLAVIAVIGLVDGGGKLAGGPAGTAGPVREVGGPLRIAPLPGWAAAEAQGAPHPELTLTRGGVTLDVVAVPGFGGSPEELATRYANEVLHARLDDLTIGQPAVGALASGTPTLRFGYIGVVDGVPVQGVVTIAVGETSGAVFDAFAPKGDLAWAGADLDTMIRDAAVG